jgi:DNA-binding CsgD family transcriptional regulator
MSTELHVIDGPNGRRIYLGKAFPTVYLTVREAEIAQLLSDFKYREIANLMNISRRTAEYYALNMKKKLGCSSKRQMIQVLETTGVVEKLKELVDVTYLFRAENDSDCNVSGA